MLSACRVCLRSRQYGGKLKYYLMFSTFTNLSRLVQFLEPESDILNHSLYDMHEVGDLVEVRFPSATHFN